MKKEGTTTTRTFKHNAISQFPNYNGLPGQEGEGKGEGSRSRGGSKRKWTKWETRRVKEETEAPEKEGTHRKGSQPCLQPNNRDTKYSGTRHESEGNQYKTVISGRLGGSVG